MHIYALDIARVHPLRGSLYIEKESASKLLSLQDVISTVFSVGRRKFIQSKKKSKNKNSKIDDIDSCDGATKKLGYLDGLKSQIFAVVFDVAFFAFLQFTY